MKEHPDYKYRPRRKPKSLVKKENKFGFSLSPLTMSPTESLSSISRGLIPPLASPMNHSLIAHDDLKIPRFFPHFPYPLYPIQHKLGDDFSGGKLAADLAFQAIYGSGGTFYSGHQSVTWPGITTPTCLQPNCGCPSPSKEPKRTFLPEKPEDKPFPSPVKPDDDRFSLDNRDSVREEGCYRKIEDNFTSSDKPQEEDKSDDRYSSSSPPPPPPVERFEKFRNISSVLSSLPSTTKTDSSSVFSVQSLTGNTSTRGHVI